MKKLVNSILITCLFMLIGGISYTHNASFYGGRLHGSMTASGERFNQNDFTAAHKQLPFGTKVKVTNPENGKSVIVRINDRGPYVKGRVIDLSSASFKAIEDPNKGIIKDVIIEVISIGDNYRFFPKVQIKQPRGRSRVRIPRASRKVRYRRR